MVMEVLMNELDILPKFLCDVTGGEISGARLFSTLLYVYLITIFQRILLAGAEPSVHHTYHVITAAFLYYYNFGVESGYFLLNVVLSYLLLRVANPSKYTVVLSIIFNMLYLMMGYASHTQSDKYVVAWTTPHAVLTLKLTGVAWDVYDGADKERSKANEETALESPPTLLELLGFAYFPPGLMTGPQISFKKYKHLTEGLYDSFLQSRWSYCIVRLSTGVMLTVAYPLMVSYLPTSFFYTEDFKNLSLITKMLLTAMWGQIILCRYLGVWLTAEGCCILSGIAFNGKDENGIVQWDGCTNILLYRFITVTQSRHYAESFHVSTNKWLLGYVYKRLRFFNNRYISHVMSLAFLSVWHGLYTGYFMCFFLEFIMVCGEALIKDLCEKKMILKSIVNHPVINPSISVFTNFMAHYGMGCGLLAFETLKYDKYMPIYADMYYLPLITYLSCPVLYIILTRLINNDLSDTRKRG